MTLGSLNMLATYIGKELGGVRTKQDLGEILPRHVEVVIPPSFGCDDIRFGARHLEALFDRFDVLARGLGLGHDGEAVWGDGVRYRQLVTGQARER
jgi:hypothetical protein